MQKKLKSIKTTVFIIAVIVGAYSTIQAAEKNQSKVWSKEKATAWYAAQAWPSGCNFQPSTAINQIEMWSDETFDAATIDRELGWAEGLGFNTMRVFLSSVI